MTSFTVNVNGFKLGSAVFFVQAENEDQAKEKAIEEYRQLTDQAVEFCDCRESLYI